MKLPAPDMVQPINITLKLSKTKKKKKCSLTNLGECIIDIENTMNTTNNIRFLII